MSSAPTLVLLPGLDGSGDLFAPFVAIARERFPTQVLRYDHDDDQSAPRLAAALLPALPVDRPFALVAESFGSPIALRLAAAAPRGLTAVVLVNGFARAPLSLARAALALPLGWTVARGLSRSPGWALRRYLLGDDAPPALVAAAREALRGVPSSTLHARLSGLAVCDETESYLRCTAPMFYLRSTGDRLLGDGALALLEYLRPGLCVESIAAPHLLLQRAPEAAFAALERLLLDDRLRA
jgi:pimeloyl-[acyl-carrier protein] methyl ester esterase